MDEAAALRYLYCMLRSQRWIHRRVDTITFSSRSRIQRHTSLDFTLPAEPPTVNVGGQDLIIIPLIQVSKEPLVGFDIRSDEDADIPILTARQSRSLATRGLLAMGDRVLEKTGGQSVLSVNYVAASPAAGRIYSLNDDSRVDITVKVRNVRARSSGDRARRYAEIQQQLVTLVAGSATEGAQALRWFANSPPGSDAGKLWARVAFRIYLRRLAGAYYVSGVLIKGDVQRPVRRVIRFEVEHRKLQASLLNPIPVRLRKFQEFVRVASVRELIYQPVRAAMENLGLAPLTLLMDAAISQDCESYHVEIVPPPGLKVSDVRWLLMPPLLGAPTDAGHSDLVHWARERILADLGEHPVSVSPMVRGGRETTRAHTVIHPVPLGYNAILRWRFSPQSTGWLLLALVTGLAAVVVQIAMVLGLSIHRVHGWVPLGTSWIFDAAKRWHVADSDPKVDALTQNRAGLILGIAALAFTALLRTGEHPLTRRLLLFSRVCIGLILTALLIAGAPLVLSDNALSGPYAFMSRVAVVSGVVGVLAFVGLALVWGTAVGFYRVPARWLAKAVNPLEDSYWRVWVE